MVSFRLQAFVKPTMYKIRISMFIRILHIVGTFRWYMIYVRWLVYVIVGPTYYRSMALDEILPFVVFVFDLKGSNFFFNKFSPNG